MSDVELLLSEQHPSTQRYALLSNEGDSIWLYLTAPGAPQIIASAWVANVIEAPATVDVSQYRSQSRPPPAPADVVGVDARFEQPAEVEWSLHWLEAGEGVQVIANGRPRAAILAKAERGLCRAIAVEGPWGAPWPETGVAS